MALLLGGAPKWVVGTVDEIPPGQRKIVDVAGRFPVVAIVRQGDVTGERAPIHRRRGLIELVGKGHFKGVTPQLMPQLVGRDRLEDQALVNTVTGMAERVGRDAFLRQQTAIMGRPDGRADLKRIACPTLVLCGRDDALTPLALHEEMAAAIPGAELVVAEDCGHLSTLERPETVNAALRNWFGR